LHQKKKATMGRDVKLRRPNGYAGDKVPVGLAVGGANNLARSRPASTCIGLLEFARIFPPFVVLIPFFNFLRFSVYSMRTPQLYYM
jgi:hypothetical protein